MWNIKQTYKPSGQVNITPDIENTEASIITDMAGNLCGRITMLAGTKGKEEIELYPPNEQFAFPVPFLGIAIKTAQTHSMVEISVQYKRSKVRRGDTVIIHFDTGETLQKRFLLSGFRVGDRRVNLFYLKNDELLYMIENQVHMIEIVDDKLGINTYYYFGTNPSRQYLTPQDGKKLLQIVARRIAGTKLMLAKR